MKKLLLATALLATGASAGNFDQMYAGLKLDHNWTTLKSEDDTYRPNGFGVGALFGHGFQLNADWAYGFEAFVGRSFSQKKVFDEDGDLQGKISRLWNFGVDARMGRIFGDSFVYGRLGFHGIQQQFKGDGSVSFVSWAMAPGAGFEHAVSQGINLRVDYACELGFKKTVQEVDMKTNSHVLSLGVSFAL